MNETQTILREKISQLLEEYVGESKTWEAVGLRDWAEKMAESVGHLLADEGTEEMLRTDEEPPVDAPLRVVGRREGYVMGIDAAARELSVLATKQLDAGYEGPMHMGAMRLRIKAQREAQRFAIEAITGDLQRDEANHVGDEWTSTFDSAKVIGVRFPLPVILRLRRDKHGMKPGTEFESEPHVLEASGWTRKSGWGHKQ